MHTRKGTHAYLNTSTYVCVWSRGRHVSRHERIVSVLLYGDDGRVVDRIKSGVYTPQVDLYCVTSPGAALQPTEESRESFINRIASTRTRQTRADKRRTREVRAGTEMDFKRGKSLSA